MIRSQKGFTLVELLVVIGIITILFAVILVAVDPARRLAQARDAVRRQDVRDILEAVQQYMVDNEGTVPTGVDSDLHVLGEEATAICDISCNATTAETDCLDLSGDLVPTYLSAIPADPSNGDADITGYAISRPSGNRIFVAACAPEIASSITVQR